MKRLFIISLVAILSLPGYLCLADNIEETFQEANKAYLKGNYLEAEKGYRKLLNEGIGSAAVHNNLGETLYRQEKLGQAIFEFMIAHRLKPRNTDFQNNLKYARAQITDKIDRPKTNLALRPFFILEKRLSRKDSWTGFALISILFWSSAILFLFFRKDWLRWFVLILGILFLLNSLILIKKEFFSRPFGVVTAEKASVFSAPGKDNVLLFMLHEGTDFQVMDGREKDWIQIKLPDGKKGWINQKQVVYLNGAGHNL